jgi:hypothetical protein
MTFLRDITYLCWNLTNTALIVAIDDYVPFDSEADCAALDSLARSVLVPSLFGTNIRLLALEGSKQTHLVYQIA